MAMLFKLFLELYCYLGLLYIHVFIALIFIYDLFAFALLQILKIVNLQSNVQDSSSPMSTEEGVFACLSSSRNSDLYFNILAATRFRNIRAPSLRASINPRDEAIWEPGENW